MDLQIARADARFDVRFCGRDRRVQVRMRLEGGEDNPRGSRPLQEVAETAPGEGQSSTTTSGASDASGGSSWARRKPRK